MQRTGTEAAASGLTLHESHKSVQQKKTPHPPPAHLVAAARRCTQRTLQLRDTEKDERQDKKRRTEEVGEDSFDAEIEEQNSLGGVIRVFLKHNVWGPDHSNRCEKLPDLTSLSSVDPLRQGADRKDKRFDDTTVLARDRWVAAV